MSFLVIREKFGYTLMKEHCERPGLYFKYGSRVHLKNWANFPLAAVHLSDGLYEKRTPIIVKYKDCTVVDDQLFKGPASFALAHNYVLQYLGLDYIVGGEAHETENLQNH